MEPIEEELLDRGIRFS